MTSFNHYALGAVADWMHRSVAGLAPELPGYRRITVRPLRTASLTHASARHHTPYGAASVAWRRDNGRFTLEVTIPPGTGATVRLPGRDPVDVGHGTHTWTVPEESTAVREPTRTVRDLIDAAPQWQQAVALFAEHGLVVDDAELARRSVPFFDAPPSTCRTTSPGVTV
jgi:alpha-L-rhamnosidase